jgi:hypothetical protein
LRPFDEAAEAGALEMLPESLLTAGNVTHDGVAGRRVDAAVHNQGLQGQKPARLIHAQHLEGENGFVPSGELVL